LPNLLNDQLQPIFDAIVRSNPWDVMWLQVPKLHEISLNKLYGKRYSVYRRRFSTGYGFGENGSGTIRPGTGKAVPGEMKIDKIRGYGE